MPDHKTILNAETHEPKHITDAVTGDAGKVITPDSSTSGISALRKLKTEELDVISGAAGQIVRVNAGATALEYKAPGGSVYGQLDVTSNTVATSITVAATDVLITGATLATPAALATAGLSNGVTFDNTGNNELLKIVTAGIYNISAAISFEGVTGATFAFHIAKNGTALATSKIRRKTANADVGAVTLIENASLAANDTIQIAVQNEGGTGNPTITDMNLNLILLEEV